MLNAGGFNELARSIDDFVDDLRMSLLPTIMGAVANSAAERLERSSTGLRRDVKVEVVNEDDNEVTLRVRARPGLTISTSALQRELGEAVSDSLGG